MVIILLTFFLVKINFFFNFFRFKNKETLRVHSQSHRDDKKQCSICKRTFPNTRSLSNHKSTHRDYKYRCFICSKAFRYASKLRVIYL